MIIKRELYLKRLRKLIDSEDVKIITGIRRSGKTCLLKMIIDELKNVGVKKENIIYISFESSIYDEIHNYNDLNKYIFDLTKNLDGKVYLLFDEIQSVDKWEKSINSFRIDLNSDIYITGSNSKLLSGELATLLSGRYKSIVVYPFSYKELLDYHSKLEELTPQRKQDLFEEYLSYGGFPGLLKYDPFEKKESLKDIYHSVILKDILNRSKIKNNKLLMKLMEYMITNTGQLFSSTKIINYILSNNKNLLEEEQFKKPSSNTVINYVHHAQDAFVLYETKNEDLVGKEVFKELEKYYVVDPGFYYIFRDETRRSMGSLLESIVYIELLRRNYDVTVGRIYDIEVDFVCKKSNKICYIQVSESIFGEKTRQREIRSLKKIRDSYPKYILTLDSMKLPTEDIIHKNIIDFLTDDEI